MNKKQRIVNGQGATNINYSTFCVLNTTKNTSQIMSLAAYGLTQARLIIVVCAPWWNLFGILFITRFGKALNLINLS